ncbi:MAG TPA: SDR family oxidoreductase [Methylomirabilota bacterium]|nr:SDR family oxidoreductase [Methylomirabilota bacterium]
MRSPRRTALITGASGGIGAELARLFAADGYDLILVARGGPALTELGDEVRARHGVSARVAIVDLAEPGAAERLWADVVGQDGSVDALVNNAGVGLYGPVAEQDRDALTRMLQLDVTAVTVLTRLALPGMLRRGWGRIMNVASVAAYQPGGARMAAYYAAKAFVLSLSRGLSRELAGTGVHVTVLSPGPTRTAFEQRAGAGRTALYRWVPAMSARDVARAGYRGVQRGRAVVIPGVLAKVLAFAGELPPRRMALEVNRWLLS